MVAQSPALNGLTRSCGPDILKKMNIKASDLHDNPEKQGEGEAPCPDFAELAGNFSTDDSLVEQVVDCFAEQLADFARFHCLDETLGKDAFQDAMITTLTKLNTYRGEGPIDAWLRRIVVSACSRLRRGRKNSPAVNIPLEKTTGSSAPADPDPGQEIRLIMATSLSRLYDEIDNLAEPNRTLLIQHDIEEVPLSELSRQHDMTVEAVKSRLKRSRAQIRENLM